VKADDFGCYHGNMKIVKSSCYPLKSDVIKDKQMISWMNELIKSNLIFIYIADDGKQYLKLTKWEKHQQRRANTPKFPLPKSSDINGNQLQANVPVIENENVIDNDIRESINEDAVFALSEFSNVKLTETERSKLYERFGVSATDEAIEQFGGWMKGNGKTKKDHYATLINWIKRNQQPEKKDVFEEARKILEAENGNK
ncbi:MAG: hypothetical protein WC998_08885, partial [Candidatus Paceibacterota bacterium]